MVKSRDLHSGGSKPKATLSTTPPLRYGCPDNTARCLSSPLRSGGQPHPTLSSALPGQQPPPICEPQHELLMSGCVMYNCKPITVLFI